MMKKVFYALAMMSGLAVSAQDVEVKWEDATKRIIGVKGDNSIIYQPDGIVDKLKKYEFPARNGLTYYHTNSKIYASVYGVVKKEKKFETNFYEVVDGKLSGEGKNVVSNDFSPVLFGNNGDRDVSGTYQSDDRGMFANVIVTSIVDDNKPEQWNITVFNEKLEPVWKRAFNPGYPDSEVELLDVVVANTGKVVLIGKVTKPGKIDKKSELTYELKCWIVSASQDKRIDIKSDGNVLPLDLVVTALDGETFAGAGVYTSAPLNPALDKGFGSYMLTFNESGITEKKSSAYSSKGLTALGAGDYISNVKSVSLAKLGSGTLVLTTAIKYSVSSSSGNSYWYTHYMNGIVNIGFNKSLEKLFETEIQNKFETRGVNDDISVFSIDDKLLILYNKETGRNYRFKTALMNSAGKIEVDKEWTMPDDGRKEYQAYPGYSLQLSNNKILVNSIMNVEYGPYGIVTIKR